MFSEKNKEYFITRYSLVPDSQIDLDTLSGVTKNKNFIIGLTISVNGNV